MAPPTAPVSLPQYIADGLPKQDDETLRDTREYIDQWLADRERRREEPVIKDELPDEVNVVEEDSREPSITSIGPVATRRANA